MYSRYYVLASLLCCVAFGSIAQSLKITRGPYLQVVTPTSITIRWRTDQPVAGRVWFGPNASSLTNSQREAQPSLDHSLTLTNLQPATRYQYAIGYDDTQVASGPDYYLQTAPVAGTRAPFRIWVLGDFGNGTSNQKSVYRAYRNATSSRPADLWLWLGDNAYCCGTEDQFQQYVFDLYGPSFRNTPFYPTPGNHDYADSRTNFDIAYYRLFSFPQQGEAGGIPSGRKSYFSADYGNVHIISLDSQAQQPDDQKRLYDTTSAQVQWLKRDLAANKLPWTLVIFHHPPYSKGSHDSDTEEQMRLLRENLTPILERYGVDMVMNGHSHSYERYYRLKDQRGLASTFDKTKHIAELTTARYDGSPNSCPIVTKGRGTVYVVNGSGGALGGSAADYPHPGMVAGYPGTSGGSMLLDVSDNRLDAQFIAADGSVQDKFTLLKQVNQTPTLTTEFADTLELSASWPGDYRWSTGPVSRTIRYVGARAGTFPITVTDARQCLADQFTITVQPPPKLTVKTLTSASVCAGSTVAVTAIPENTTKAAGWQYDVLLSDASGSFVNEQVVGSGSFNALTATFPASLSAGTGYRLRVRPKGIAYAQSLPSDGFSVQPLPTATLSGSTTVVQGQPASLTISFTGDGPWRGSLSDGTSFSLNGSPNTVPIQPIQTGIYSIKTVENSCGAGRGIGQASVTVLLPTGVEEFAGGRLQIYPNPTHDVVFIDFLTPNKGEICLLLRDDAGRAVYQKQLTVTASLHESIVLPSQAGTYLLTVQIGQQTMTRKLVKQ